MAQALKCNITLLGLFPLPDIFVNKENIKSDEIKRGVYEISLGKRYEHQNQLPINFEYFDGPRKLPDTREENDFWGSVLGYGWAPLFYKSRDDLNIEIISCEDENTTDLFNKLSLSKKAPTRFFIRIFPIGGYSVHMVFDFTISNNSECFTVEDLKTMVEDIFDRIKFKLKTKSEVILFDITISKLFERFGSRIRKEFLRNPNQMHLGTTKHHAIIDIDKYKGDWRKEDIEDLAGGYIKKLGTKPEDLLTGRDNTIITSDVYYSGEICTLLALTTTTEKGKKSLKNKTIDVAEFVHLRKLIVEEYTKHITQKNIEIAGKIDDLNYLNALKYKLSRKKITWINERFIANLQTLIELDEKISSTNFKKNIVSGMLERIEYKNTLNILKKELERTQNYTEKYNKEFAKRLKFVINAIEVAIGLIT